MQIYLKDNTPNQKRELEVPCDESRKVLSDISGKKFSELSEKGFVLYPPMAKDADLKHNDVVFHVHHFQNSENVVDFSTNNIMGFFGLGDGTQMQIASRFDFVEDSSKPKNYFLHYMLQKVCNVAFTPKTDTCEYSLFDFLYYLFPSYLNAALMQGVYRTYVTHEYNDANVRGPIEVPRHIRHDVPFNGKIAYRTREYTTDNGITQLVRHTIEHIRSLAMGKSVLNGGAAETHESISAIEHATQTYSRKDRQHVIAKNLRPVTHPYYTAYEPLRKLCIAILTHQKLNYGENSSKQISGIIFDGASLWEEYLNVVIRDGVKIVQEGGVETEPGYGSILVHPNNRNGSRRFHLFSNDSDSRRVIYPDFLMNVSRDNKTAEVVLDAKYKNLNGCIGREDSFQMLSYMFRFGCKQGILINPCYGKLDQEKSALGHYELFGDASVKVDVIPFNIPQYDKDTDYESFKKLMETAEKDFLKKIERILIQISRRYSRSATCVLRIHR